MALYTSYIGNYRKIPKHFMKVLICNYPPENLLKPGSGFCWFKDLAPEQEKFNSFKSNAITLDVLFIGYRHYIESSIAPKNAIEFFCDISKEKDIVFLCFEKDYTTCHRNVLASHIRKQYKMEVREL